ncbi:MAG: excinuclease ABC subunit UvrA [Firmicutes bacterium]|nr:excinuclease ABC subunit UvrA [Bacillota bacterium]
MLRDIVIKGAKENNLKSLDVTIPREKMVVFTGVSGSGKSTLAFDTIFAEGQRRYIESLSSYARQFLGQMQKPDVDSIDGLSPAISIDQKTTNNNPRSTVGTVTEIYDYLRVLFARVGTPHCPVCGKIIAQQSIDQITGRIASEVAEGTKFSVVAPVIRGQKGEHSKLLEGFRKSGYVRVNVDGHMYNLDEEIVLDKNKKHNIAVVVDRLIMKPDINKRLSESIETAIKVSDGTVNIITESGTDLMFSTKFACDTCNVSFEEITPRLFSFNSPFGACSACHGLGFKSQIDANLIIKDGTKSINQGGLNVSGWNIDSGLFGHNYFVALSDKYKFSLDTPLRDLPKGVLDILLYGTKGDTVDIDWKTAKFSGKITNSFEGIVNNLQRRYNETTSEYIKWEIGKYMNDIACPTCGGFRLKPEALGIKIDGKNITQFADLAVSELLKLTNELKFTAAQSEIATPILKEINARLQFLCDVGLNYLTLSRSAGSLSGGEAQRIRLATQIGSGLTGVLYILDEPSIGLHQRDNERLLYTLKRLRDLGNTLIVVEHDEDTIRAGDHIIDIGPLAGVNGGELVAQGTLDDIIAEKRSITGQYMAGVCKIEVPNKRRPAGDKVLQVMGAKENNLQNINVSFPLGVLNVVTGVSGSGKSSLVTQILHPALANKLNGASQTEGRYERLKGTEHLDKAILIDQSPIGRTPRSNPATYTGVFTLIRDLFAATPEAKQRGYASGRFSFNVSGGRCEACSGDGIKKIEMYFLPDVYVPCEVCRGKRYTIETLEVKFKGKSIYDVLHMTVTEALEFFSAIPAIAAKIQTLYDVGLGYIRLGQPATTLSGGEAQRVKLATELSKRSTGKTVYILDEPTTGLHMYDVDKLITILQRLVNSGNTVIVIEHNLDVIKVADYCIDLGPEGGNCGGLVVASGTPEQIANNADSITGKFLKKVLG